MSTLNPGPDGTKVWQRLGIALSQPRWAIAMGGDPHNHGRASSDLLLLLLGLVIGVHLRGVVAAIWLGAAASPGLGVKTLVSVVSSAVTMPLAFVVITTALLFIVAGKARSLGRAFDLASVCAVPLVIVLIVATALAKTIGIAVPAWASIVVAAVAFGWSSAIAITAVPVAKQLTTVRAIPPQSVRERGLVVGGGVVFVLIASLIANIVWIATHLDLLKPLSPGDPAPAIELPTVTANGELGPQWTLAADAGKPIIIDFWATWCGPCLQAMPDLAASATKWGDRVRFVAINLDSPSKAKQLFAARNYPMKLLYDDRGVAERYGVHSIPHLVIIDAAGKIRALYRGGASSDVIDAALTQLLP